jgi:hypothetical protein
VIFAREFVVLHTTTSMFSKFCGACLEVVWRFEQRTFYKGSLRIKLTLACQEVPEWAWPSMNWNTSFKFKFKHYLRACTTSGKKSLLLYAKQLMENRRGPTPNKKSHKLKVIPLLSATHSKYLHRKTIALSAIVTLFHCNSKIPWFSKLPEALQASAQQ